jgi:hypothetical protein
MMRRAGQQVKSLPVIYVMSAFSGPAFPGSHFWSGISGLECDQAYRAPQSRGFSPFRCSWNVVRIAAIHPSRSKSLVNNRQSQIALTGPKAASEDRSKMPVNGG